MNNKIREGDLYKIMTVCGETFEIRYGYYEEKERYGPFNEPIPIYPDFLENPLFTKDGYPFVTQMQDACEGYAGQSKEDGCFGCKYYRHGEDLLGICIYGANKKRNASYIIEKND